MNTIIREQQLDSLQENITTDSNPALDKSNTLTLNIKLDYSGFKIFHAEVF